ncbi:MAG: thioredoxin domain-containing protein, partial [Candidatus Thorarchaeota archaeon]
EALDSTNTSIRTRQLDIDDIENAFASYTQRFDQKKGGFGKAPKFPSPHNMLFLLRYWKRTGDKWALHMVEKTLKEMRIGGVYDQIGFGFHRYSTDQHWLLPHFEKMLYDQAMMLMAYTEAYLATKDPFYATVADEIVAYLKRDLMSPEGVFYSAEDADSEGEEGKFYVWTYDEVKEILTDDEFTIFSKVFNIKEEGNFHDEATRMKTGKNIPFLTRTLEMLVDDFDADEKTITEIVERSRRKLLEVRSRRIRPHLDDKVLTDWNGMVIAAIAKASRAFDNSDYLELAERAMEFLIQNMKEKDGRLLHRYREGEAVITGFLDDYAYISWGLLELYYATFNTTYLVDAEGFMQILLEHFWDDKNGGFYFTDTESEVLLSRQIDAYDGAIPSGNSVSMYNLIRLGRMLGNSNYEDRASEIGARFSGIVESSMGGFSMLLSALDFALGPTHEVVIAGNPELEDTMDMLAILGEHFLPNTTTMLRGTKEQQQVLSDIASYTRYHTMVHDKATAHVCVEQNCKLPTTETAKLIELLGLQG